MSITTYRNELKEAILHVLRAKAGCWIQRQDLFAAVKKHIGYEPRYDVFLSAISDLRRSKTVFCHNEDNSYSVPDTETIDMFENLEDALHAGKRQVALHALHQKGKGAEMSSQLCRYCDHYCVYCQICHVDKDYHDFNDSCRDFTPEDGEETEEESEVSE